MRQRIRKRQRRKERERRRYGRGTGGTFEEFCHVPTHDCPLRFDDVMQAVERVADSKWKEDAWWEQMKDSEFIQHIARLWDEDERQRD